jgi:hypothetical protein
VVYESVYMICPGQENADQKLAKAVRGCG